MKLSDDGPLCALARFCDTNGGIWKQTTETDQPESRELGAHQATHCPSGRLLVHDKQDEEVLEPEFEPSIVLIEDPALRT